MLALIFAAAIAITPAGPDPKLTPGALCSYAAVGFDGYRYPEHVAHCARMVTTTMKRTVLASYGIAWSKRGAFTIDHLVPLCLGGSNDISNLWPETTAEAHSKDALEDRLCAALRAGRISQAEAVGRIKHWKP